MHLSSTTLLSAVAFVGMNPWSNTLFRAIGCRFWRHLPMLLAATVILGTVPLQAQRRYNGGDHNGPPPDLMSAAVAKFAGKLRVVDKKQIVIVAADDQLVTFHRSRKTRFLLDQKPIKPEEIPLESMVTVEASKDSVGDLVAVDIIWKKS